MSINHCEFKNVLRVSFMDLLRWNAIAGDLESAVRVFNDYRESLPVGKKHVSTEGYNLVMSLYAREGKDLDAVEMFRGMIKDGANPNSRSYTVIMEHLVGSGRLGAAFEVFAVLPSIRIKRTLKQYSVLVDGFILNEDFNMVKTLLNEMRNDGVLPGYAMRVSLKRMQEAGFVEETEEFVRELLPDERIGNIGFAVDGSEDEEDGDDGGVEENVKLKPWLDPSALASVLSDWNPDEVLALEDARLVWTTRLVCKFLRSFKKAETAWKFFCWVAYQPGDFNHDVHTVSRMIAILVREGNVDLVDQLIIKVKREGIRLSFSTIRLIVDFYGFSKKPDPALRIFDEIELLCGPVSKVNLKLVYCSLLRTLVKCKRGPDAMNILEGMISSGVLPDIQTFTGLMQYFASVEDLRMVQKLFGIVRQSGIEPDAFMFKTLIRTYCKHGQFAFALRVFKDMMNLNLFPDGATKTLLVKCLWNDGKLREAAFVEERSEEINEMLPLAVPGHVWTTSCADLRRVYSIYYNSFAADGE
ncbi:hypothetical protein GIB67_017396 [Kingdonia uniflora]|uniref:Pentatricopeptide repeat-containing protein n=1 Tax=Kingdonia uniflora TaxID=39325 RepID=A0A7J7M464_9MAGN|nr:hypothetical protein GIB67_017396 [Kingdonia uniflora]